MRTRGESSRRCGTPTGSGRPRPSTSTSPRSAGSSAPPAWIVTVRGVPLSSPGRQADQSATVTAPLTRRLVLGSVAVTAFVLVVLMVPLGVASQRGQLRGGVGHRAGRRRAGLLRGGRVRDRTNSAPPCRSGRALRRRRRRRVVVVGVDGVALPDTDPPGGGERLRHPPGDPGRPQRRRATGTAAPTRSAPISSTSPCRRLGRPRPGGGAGDLPDRRGRRPQTPLLTGVVRCGPGVVVVALVGIVIARGVTRPLRQILEAAERHGGGDLARRVPETAGPRSCARWPGLQRDDGPAGGHGGRPAGLRRRRLPPAPHAAHRLAAAAQEPRRRRRRRPGRGCGGRLRRRGWAGWSTACSCWPGPTVGLVRGRATVRGGAVARGTGRGWDRWAGSGRWPWWSLVPDGATVGAVAGAWSVLDTPRQRARRGPGGQAIGGGPEPRGARSSVPSSTTVPG